jgi:cytochrome c2
VSPRALAAVALLALGAGLGACTEDTRTAAALTGGDPEKGRQAVRRYGCSTCHSIPRVPGAVGTVGPPLDRMARRAYVAGRLSNTPENLRLWIQHPQQVDPPNAMPDMGVTDQDSRDIAAFLYTLR